MTNSLLSASRDNASHLIPRNALPKVRRTKRLVYCGNATSEVTGIPYIYVSLTFYASTVSYRLRSEAIRWTSYVEW